MKVALVQAPAWAIENPNYSQAYLTACLKKEGFEVACFDINREFYNYCCEKGESLAWDTDDKKNHWFMKEFVENFTKKYSTVIDSYVDAILSFAPTVIGFTVYGQSFQFSGILAARIKQRDPRKVVVFGGPQCFRNSSSLSILDADPNVDAVCLGEGEVVLPNFLCKLGKGGVIPRCSGFGIRDNEGKVIDCGDEEKVADLDAFPFADYSEYRLGGEIRDKLGIATSRGCIQRCKFCHESTHWGRFRTRSAENIVAEMEHQLSNHPTITYFHFNVSLLNGNIRNLRRLCELLIEKRIKTSWGGQALIRKEMDKELLAKMKEAGWAAVSYGLENGSQTVLDLMNKKCNISVAEEVIINTHKLGIYTQVNFIVGYPGEGEKEFKETCDFLKSIRKHVDLVGINPLLLFKGSYLFNHKEEMGLVMPNQLLWYTRDESSTYEVRIKRLNTLKSIVSVDTSVAFTDGNTLMYMGDDCVNRKRKAKAMRYYLQAHEFFVSTSEGEKALECKKKFNDLRERVDMDPASRFQFVLLKIRFRISYTLQRPINRIREVWRVFFNKISRLLTRIMASLTSL